MHDEPGALATIWARWSDPTKICAFVTASAILTLLLRPYLPTLTGVAYRELPLPLMLPLAALLAVPFMVAAVEVEWRRRVPGPPTKRTGDLEFSEILLVAAATGVRFYDSVTPLNIVPPFMYATLCAFQLIVMLHRRGIFVMVVLRWAIGQRAAAQRGR